MNRILPRAQRFFAQVRDQDVVWVITTTGYAGIIHAAIKAQYRAVLPHHRNELFAAVPGKRWFDWLDLYKVRPDLIPKFAPFLEQLRVVMSMFGLVILQPDDLSALPADRRYEQELPRLVVRYQLDTSDAAILLEARHAGIAAIATLDADMHRAQRDFDVYTWL